MTALRGFFGLLLLISPSFAGVKPGSRYCDSVNGSSGTTTVNVHDGAQGWVIDLRHSSGASGYPTLGIETPGGVPGEIERSVGSIEMGGDWYRISDGKLQKFNESTNAWDDMDLKRPTSEKRRGGSDPDPGSGDDSGEQEAPPPGADLTGGRIGSLPINGSIFDEDPPFSGFPEIA